MNLKLTLILTLLFASFLTKADESAEEVASEVSALSYPYIVNSKNPQDMRVINSGPASLYARIDMIRRATKSIELETFIFKDDTAGRIVLQELAAAAKRGVKVKVLIDKAFFNLRIDDYYAQVLQENGVEVRYYNNTPITNFSTVQYRNHRKLMVVDDKEAITGGRNIADEYFELSPKFNFLDRDTTIEGDLVKPMKETFDLYWDSKMTEVRKPLLPPDPSDSIKHDSDALWYEKELVDFNAKMEKAKKILIPNDEDKKTLSFIMETGKESLEKNKKLQCPEASFATDREGAGFLQSLSNGYRKHFRLLRKEISKWMKSKVKKKLTIDSPYFLDNQFTDDIEGQLDNKTEVDIMTNSFSSSDAINVVTVFNDSISRFTNKKHFTAYTYKGKFSDEGKFYSDETKNAVWGTHSKTMVFDDDAFMIGTFNMDNRSEEYNAEMAIFCSGNKELTLDIKNNIEKRMQGSNRLNEEGDPDDCSGIFGNSSSPSSALKRTFYYLIKIPSHLLQFLL
jgi:putative cardiolipin synthase